jgi:hypothetical protein
MPKAQTGSVVKRGTRNYGARFYDETGRRRYQGGFETATAAEMWLRTKVDAVIALRRGDPSALRRREMPTLGQLADAVHRSARRRGVNDREPRVPDSVRA